MSQSRREILLRLAAGQLSPEQAAEQLARLDGVGLRAPISGGCVDRSAALAHLQALLSEVIKLEPSRIDVDAPLTDYGLDSLMAVRLTRRLEETLGSLPKTLFFEFSSLGELADHLLATHPEGWPQVEIVEPHAGRNGSAKPPSGLTKAKASLPSPATASAWEVRPFEGDEPLDIAIVGLAGRFPGASDLEGFWQNLREGRDSVRLAPAERGLGQVHGGFLDDVTRFDAEFFGIAPREARIMDPQERLFLECAYHALEDAGALNLRGESVGVFAGVMYQEHALHGVEETLRGRPVSLSSNAATIANRVSYVFDFRGPSLACDSMCSSSLTAIHLACQSLRRGECQAALAGGVNLWLHSNRALTLAQGRFASARGRCAAFGEDGDGYVPGEAVSVALLKPLRQAVADGDQIHAVIEGSSISHGGRGNGYTVPSPRSQASVIQSAMQQASVSAVDYLEAHGTGTSLGDPIEIEGLTRAYREMGHPCPIGSVKSNIGHCESAAGMAALCKAILQFRHQELAPSLHCQNLNSNIDFSQTPFRVQRQSEPWPRGQATRRAGISSFGAGGANAHLILREGPLRELPSQDALEGPVAIVLSAATPESLEQKAAALAGRLGLLSEGDLPALAYTLQLGREPMEQRWAMQVHSLEQLRFGLEAFSAEQLPAGVFRGTVSKESRAAFATPELESALEAMLAGEQYDRLLKLWTTGVELNWRPLYPEAKTLLSLPGYPFGGDHHWVPSSGDVQGIVSALHPWLGASLPDLDGPRFATTLRPTDPVLSEHRLDSRPLLPAVALLEMARAALSLSTGGGEEPVRLSDVVWARPLFVQEPTLVETCLSRSDGQNALFEMLREGQPVCWGKAAFASAPSPSHAALVARIASLRDGVATEAGDLYHRLAESGLAIDPAQQGLRRWWRQGDEALAELVDPNPGREAVGLPRAILDGALHAIAAFADLSEGESGHLPFALDELLVLGPCAARMLVLLTRLEGAYDLTLTSPEGQPAVVLRGLRTRAAASNQDVGGTEDEPVEGLLLLAPVWEEALPPAVESKSGQRRLLLCSGVEVEGGVPLRAADVDGLALEVFTLLGEQLRKPERDPLRVQVVVSADDEGEIAAAALSGLLKSAAQEHPHLSTQVLRWEGGCEDLSAALLQEASSTDVDVRYRQGQREVLRWTEDRTSEAFSWKNEEVTLISGGAGGLGLIVAEEIARQAPGSRIVLVGRGELGEREKRIQALRELGADVHYARLDIADAAQVRRLVDETVGRWGRLDIVIHAAGVLRDSWLLRKSEADFRQVWSAKMDGLRALDLATSELPLRAFVIFSSASGALGNAGQCDYASANAAMDAFAGRRQSRVQQRSRYGLTLSLNWPLWAEGGMTVPPAAVKRMREQVGLVPMASSTGLLALRRALASERSQLMPLEGELSRLRQAFVNASQASPSALASPAAAPPAETPLTASSELESDRLLHYLRHHLAKVSGLAPDRIRPGALLEEVGIDSVMVLELTQALESDLGRLPKTLLFEYPTLQRLADYLRAEHGPRLQALLGREKTPRPAIEEAPRAPAVRGRQARRKTARRAQASSSLDGALEVAIIGLAGSYAQSPDMATLWRNLSQGRDCVTPLPEGRWPQTHYPPSSCPWGGFLPDVDSFDPFFFGISPAEAEILDPQERLFLQTAYHALEDAGYQRRPLAPEGDRVGVFVGVMNGEYQLYGVEESALGRPLALSSHAASIANRVSYFCNFRGPCLAVDSMCSSSLTALHLACQSLLRGECAMALAGGVNLSLHPNKYLMLAQGRFTSSKGRCAAFGEGGDGYVPGEGVGAVLLKPLQQALADNDAIYGVIQGSALNHGGKTNGYSVPNPWAQSLVIDQALRQAGVSPDQLGYLEAHGTGTSLGDPIEIAGLSRAFATSDQRDSVCAIGSVKTNLGHCEGAAGMAALSKVLLQLQHRQVAPSLHSESLNPHIDFAATPFAVAQRLQDWPRPAHGPRLCGISSFGAGGSNAHLIVQEAPDRTTAARQGLPLASLFLLSARRPDDFPLIARRLAEALAQSPALDLASVAYTLQVGREAKEHRLALRAHSLSELIGGLETVAGGGEVELPSDPLAAAWLAGQDVDWEAHWSGAAPGRLHLPGYPFRKVRCWAPRSGYPTAGPSLSQAVALATGTVLGDHTVGGQAVLPAARSVEMLLVAAGDAPPLALQDLLWLRPLSGQEQLQVRTTPLEGSSLLELLGEGPQPYCRARLREGGPAAVISLSLDEVEAQCLEHLEPSQLYSDFAERGLYYGPSYRVIRELRRGSARLLARLELRELGSESALPAPLLDGVFQSCLALMPQAEGAAGLVFALERLEIFQLCPEAVWAVVEQGKSGFDFQLCDDHGKVVARGAGLAFRAAPSTPSPSAVSEVKAPPEEARREAGSISVAGSSLQEKLLQRVAATLKVPVEALDANSPLADFGLDSITGVGLVEELNEELGIELGVTSLFEHNSTALLAAHILRHWPEVERAAVPQLSNPVEVKASQQPDLRFSAEPPAPSREPIAIIGMSGRFAHSPDLDTLWSHLEAGNDLVDPVTRWDLPGCHGSLLEDIAAFDPLFFRISAVEACYMDPQQRIFLEECWKALEDAGYAGEALRGSRCGVFAGVHENDYDHLFQGQLPAQAVWGNMAAVIPSRIAYHLDLRGPTMVVDTACSSSLVAVHLACQSLWSGETDLALAGGVAVRCTPAMWDNGKDAGMVSPSGRCYTFDARADGFVPGEGAGVVVLKPLSRALADGDTVQAVIRGSGVNQDGASNGLTAPSAAAQERLEREVHERFGVNLDHVGMVEAHGSATPLGDPIEVEALTRAFAGRTDRKAFCALGSIKSNLGHTVAAAGVAGLLKALLSLRHRRLPPTLHCLTPNPKIQLRDGPFYLNTELREWQAPEGGAPRCALINSFGASGTNAHLVVQEAPALARAVRSSAGPQLLLLSARTPEQLRALAHRLIDRLDKMVDGDLEAVAFTLASGRKHLPYRLAWTASSVEQAASLLRSLMAEQGQGAMPCRPSDSSVDGQASLERQAQAFLQGQNPRVASQGRRVPLPTYPFAADRYWVDQPAPVASMGSEALEAPEESNDVALLHRLKTLLSKVTGYPYQDIDETQPNELYGLDSLMIGQLNEALAENFSQLSHSLFFECPSLAAVAAHLRGKHPAQCARWLGESQPRAKTKPLACRLQPKATLPLSALPTPPSQTMDEPIAIIGLSGRYPGARNPDELWQTLSQGRCAIGEIPAERWSLGGFYHPEPEAAAGSGRSYSRWGGFLQDFAEFDPLFFRMSPREAASMDPQERLFLSCCWEALEDAACTPAGLQEKHAGRVGVFVGVTKQGLSLHSVDSWRRGDGTYPRTSFGSIANRVSYLLDLRGPSMPVDTLCSSSLTALHEACEHLRRGECELALAGGVNLYLHPLTYIELCTQQMLSPDGVCRPFGEGANGFVPGEGVGAVLLKPLSAALRDGDPIHALIRGSAVNHDGKTNGYTVPNPAAQTDVVRQALKRAGVSADDVSYVEAHGTGTALGDPIEVNALTQAFRGDTERSGFCALGSIKGSIGHLEAAAGIAGLTKLILQLRHRVIAPTLHSGQPSAAIPFASTPFRLPQAAESWTTPEGRPRLAGLSSFGAGGSNAHLLVQEAPPESVGEAAGGESRLVVLSAVGSESLRESAERLLAFATSSEVSLEEMAYTLQVGRVAFEHRLALVAGDLEEMKEGLRAFLSGQPAPGVHSGRATSRGALSRLSSAELAPLLRSWLEQGQLDRLAELWVEGARLPWELLYGDGPTPRRRHLPTYPFARQRFWTAPDPASARLHPLLHENVSQLGRQSFCSRFDSGEVVLGHHQVEGRPVMPGAAWLEMAREAVSRSLGLPLHCPLVLRDVTFVRPFDIETDPRAVEIVVSGSLEEGIEFAIESDAGTHCQGWAELGLEASPLAQEPLSGEASLTPEALYRRFDGMGIVYGPAFQAVRQLRKHEGAIEVELELPESQWSAGLYGIHPALLDAATQAIVALHAEESSGPMLPFSVERLEFHGAFPTRMTARVSGGGERFDVELYSAERRLLARLSGLLCRPARASGVATRLLPVWDPVQARPGHEPGILVGPPRLGLAGLGLHSEHTVEEMVAAISASPQPLQRLILIAPDHSGDTEIDSQRPTRLLFRLLKALLVLGYDERRLELVVLTRGCFALEPEDRVAPWHAGLHGLLRSAAAELPLWSTRVADLPLQGELRREWLDVPASDDRGSWAWRHDQWYEQHLLPLRRSEAGPQNQELDLSGEPMSGPMLILGGAGGLGQVLAQHTLRRGGGPVILVGRSSLDAALGALERLGALGQVEYRQLDAGDGPALQALVADLRSRYGRLDTVVHSVLVLADRSLREMDEATFESAFAAKSRSCLALAQALAAEPPRQLLFFSSMIAFQSAAGQANYAAGTTFADASAEWLRERLVGCQVKVMNWGFWGHDGAVATPEYRARLASRGVASIEPREGLAALDRFLCGPLRQLGYLKTREPLPSQEQAVLLDGGSSLSALPALPEQNASALEAPGSVVNSARQALAAMLAIEAEALDVDLPLRDLGVDSLLLSRLVRMLGAEVTLDHTLSQLRTAEPIKVAPSMAVTSGDGLPAEDLAEAEEFEAMLASLLACQLVAAGVRQTKAIPATVPAGWGQASADFLQRAGLLRGDTIVAEAADDVWARWLQRRAVWSLDPDRQAQLEVAEQALRTLPQVLSGQLSATELLFPGGSTARVEGLYRDNRLSDFFNAAVAREVASFSDDGGLRILEVGAGTGGTTAAVLRLLPSHRIAEYAFTDLSPAFLEPARARFGATCPAMTFRRFDVGLGVAQQGFAAGRYDLVLATNVIHATPNIRRSLRNAKALLRPGGGLLLNEMSRANLFTHLTFGLLPAWWSFEDPSLRLPGSPALGPSAWRRVLRECGFLATSFPVEAAHAHGQQVILALSDGLVRQPVPNPPAASRVSPEVAPREKRRALTSLPASRSSLSIPVRSPVGRDDWRTVARQRLLELAAEALAMDSTKLDPEQPLEIYGMDSIMAVALTNSLRRLLPELKTSAVFEHQTWQSLSDELLATHAEQLRAALGLEPRATSPSTDRSPARATLPLDVTQAKLAGEPSGPFEVAVIGLAGRYPGASNPDQLWQLLSQGRDSISEVPAQRWDWRAYHDERRGVRGRSYSRWGGFLDDIAGFDPLFFGISPAEAEDMDPQERLFLQEAYAAIEDAGYTPEALSGGGAVGVFVGAMNGHYRMGPDYWSIANRVSYSLDFRGPSMAIDSACSSSLTAIHLALESLASGTCQRALAGGVSLIAGPTHMLKLSAMTMLTSDARNKSFSAEADGFVDGEAVGVVLLKPLAEALRDGDQIYGVLRGSMLNAGGKTHGYTVPNPRAQAEVIEGALRRAGVAASELSYVEAHGTGTALGDPIELAGLTRAFASSTDQRGFCAIGSIKSNIGHSESAAGIAGLTKLLLQFKHGRLAPTLHCHPANPEIAWDSSPFRLQHQLAPWPGAPGTRLAGLSSFGAGGANAHLIVGEAPLTAALPEQPGPYLFVLSGRDEGALDRRVSDLLAWSQSSEAEQTPLRDVAYTLAVGRKAMAQRLAFVAGSYSELRQRLSGQSQLFRGGRGSGATHPGLAGDDLTRLAVQWVGGDPVDWGQHYGSFPGRRVSLPTYPFANERYWAPGWALPLVSEVEEKAPVLELGGSVESMALQALKEAVSQVLKLPVEALVESLPLDEIGFNSILAVEATRCLEERFGPLPSTLFFEARDLRGLASHLAPLIPQKSHQSTSGTPQRATMSEPSLDEPIAIIGLAGRYAQADSLDELWDNLRTGRDCISEIPPERWNHALYYDADPTAPGKTYARWAGLLRNVDHFDARFFAITPHEAEMMDPQERLFLECVQHVLDDAATTRQRLGAEVGVFVGVMNEEYQLFGAAATAKGQPLALPGSAASVANRVSYAFDFQGPSLACDSMCSSSLTAIHLACQALRAGECSSAIAGGVNVCLHPNKLLLLGRTKFAASDGRCRAFGEGGDGYVPAEGVGAVLLKPLSQALADGDLVRAVIRGSAVNHGGKTNGYTVPNPEAQASVIERAYRNSGVDSTRVSYLEAHGTGTPLGDPIELSALARAFDRLGGAAAGCSIGSIKSSIGHCESAAGIAGLTKVLLQMRHGRLAPSLHAEKLNPNLDFSSTPFVLQRYEADWPRRWNDGQELPRVAGISSFGAGGSNAHLIVEEVVEPAWPDRRLRQDPLVVPLSARHPKALEQTVQQLSDWLRNHPTTALEDVVLTLRQGRLEMVERVAFVVSSSAELRQRLERFSSDPRTADARGRAVSISSVDSTGGSESPYQAAAAWVVGLPLAALSFDSARRLRLPGYDFQRERFWAPPAGIESPELGHAETSSARPVDTRLHPLVQRRIRPDLYASVFHGGESFLADHRVAGCPVLPAAALLEMARAAAALAKPGQSLALEDVVFLRPLRVESPTEVQVRLADTVQGGLAFSIVGTEDQLHCRGTAQPCPLLQEAQDLDLERLRRECSLSRPSVDEIYRRFDSLGLEYGPTHRRLRELFAGTEQVLSQLNGSLTQQMMLEPGLLDGALQSMLALGEPGGLPFSLRRLRVFAPCTSPMWSRLTRRSADEVDLQLCDDQGRVLASLEGLRLRGGGARETLLMAQPRWRHQAISEQGTPQATMVILCGCQAPGVRAISLPWQGPDLGSRFQAASIALAQRLRELPAQGQPLLVQLVVPAAGQESYARGLSAMLATAAQENPRLRHQTIAWSDSSDSSGDLALTTLLDRNALRPQDSQVRYQGGQRLVLEMVEVDPVGVSNRPWRDHGVYLISGGAGGLGQVFAREIARSVQSPVLVLLGRSRKGPDLSGLLAAGAQAEYHSVDLADRELLGALIDDVRRRRGGLNGVLHSAGVTRDSRLARKTAAEIVEVMAPKVSGLIALDEATAEDSLDLFVAFSSVSALSGNPGQADYAAANAFLDAYMLGRHDKVAQGKRCGQSCTINWPLWRDGGMQVSAAQEKALWEGLGMRPMTSASGLRAFYRILGAKLEQALVMEGDRARLRRAVIASDVPADASSLAASTLSVPAGVEDRLLEVLSKVTGLARQSLLWEESLHSLGLNSVMSVEATSMLSESFGPLPSSLFFEHETLADLRDALANLVAEAGQSSDLVCDRELPGEESVDDLLQLFAEGEKSLEETLDALESGL